MRISNILLPGLLGIAPLWADDLTIAGGSTRLSGSVRSIDEQGSVELASPLSPAPLILKSGTVDKVDFSTDEAAAEQAPALVELANGDRLPATIEGLDEAKLSLTSPHLGKLEIPRDALGLIQLGIRQGKLIYSGPVKLADWMQGEVDSKNWNFENRGLLANGPATAARKVDLPEQFVLRFTLKWEARGNPNFEVTFADPMIEKGKAADRYLLHFNSAGFQIQREASKGQHYGKLINLARLPNQFPERSLEVEIRVNRKTAKLQVYLNGEPEGECVDPLIGSPTGNGIVFTCNNQNGQTQEIRDIQVLELEDSAVRHRAEERGDPNHDSLISRDDERWGGKLLEIRGDSANQVFRIKSEFQNDPLDIPATDVSTVFFKLKPDAGKENPKCPYLLRIKDKGVLSVNSCRFDAETVSAVHPLLGPITIRRDGVTSLQRTETKSKPES